MLEAENFACGDTIKNVFVDCFNTIIIRDKSSDDIIYFWAKRVGDCFQIEPTIIYKLFKSIRFKENFRMWRKTRECETPMKSILEIMATMLSSYIDNFDCKNFVNESYKMYIATEAESHSLNKSVVEELRQYKSYGAKIYVISDFYCGKTAISAWLDDLGVLDLFDNIFVSCDYGHSKSSGKLYKQILYYLNADPKSTIMIGDNLRSDYKKAKSNKLKAVKIDATYIKNDKSLTNAKRFGVSIAELQKCFDMYGDKYNYSNYAFALFLFTKRLYQNLKANNIKNVFFLSREGQFLKKLFDIYAEILKTKNEFYAIKTHYFYASRNSVLNASFNSLENEDFYYLFRASPHMSLKKFMITIGFEDIEIDKVKKSLQLDFDKRIRNIKKSTAFAKLKNDETFQNLFDIKRREQNTAFSRYIASFDVDLQKEGFTLVDIGWKGTMQDLFEKYFGARVKVRGYFIGSCKKGETNKYGLLYDKNNKKQFGNNVHRHIVYNYEQLCRANHNRCNAYKIVNGQPQVILDSSLHDAEIYHNLTEELQKQIIEKFKIIAELDYVNLSFAEQLTSKMFYKMFKKESKADYDWLIKSQNTHHDNFGDVRYPFKAFAQSLRKFAYKTLDMNFLILKSAQCNPRKFKLKKLSKKK